MRRRKRTGSHIKRLLLYLIMIPLTVWVLIRLSDTSSTVRDTSDPSSVTVTMAPDSSDVPMPTAEVIWTYPEGYVDLSDLPDVDLTTWQFTLVNALDKENYLRDSFVPNLVSVEGFQVRVGVDEPLQRFLTAARDAGFTVSISRAYMSYYEISYRFNGTASGLKDGKGISYEAAVEEAKSISHYPGTDEHQLGVAVNFIDGEGNWQGSSPCMQWMAEHCAEYGFILRYPLGKDGETGWEYTPNQFRYVGPEAAGYIMDKGISLEEFLQAYKNAKEWSIS